MGEKLDRLQVSLAQTHVKQYLRKGESGKIENVEDYIRSGVPIRGKTAGGNTYIPRVRKKAGTPTKVRGYAGPRRSAKEAKAILRKQREGEFLGHDANGNEIKVGGRVHINAGPDKGMSGTVTGQVQGGGVSVELKQSLGKTRTAAVDPDELKVIRQFKADKAPEMSPYVKGVMVKHLSDKHALPFGADPDKALQAHEAQDHSKLDHSHKKKSR